MVAQLLLSLPLLRLLRLLRPRPLFRRFLPSPQLILLHPRLTCSALLRRPLPLRFPLSPLWRLRSRLTRRLLLLGRSLRA